MQNGMKMYVCRISNFVGVKFVRSRQGTHSTKRVNGASYP